MAHNQESGIRNQEFVKYLSATKDEFLKIKNTTENTKPLGVRVMRGAAVGYWRPQIHLKKQPIKNVKIWESGGQCRGKSYIDQDVILLGFAETFFGHFLADSLSRAWVALDPKYSNAQFVIVAEKDVPAFGRDLYALLGIKNLIVVKKKTRFRSITIPESSFNYPARFYDKKYTDTFDAIAAAVGPHRNGAKKIYFSRMNLATNPTIGEGEIQEIFANNGYTVIPSVQTMPMRDQIALARGATHIAGIEGTAIHQSLFARDGIRLTVVHRYNAIMPMQILIDKLKNIDATYIDASLDPYSKRKNESPVTIVGLNANMRAFLDDHKFKYDAGTAIDDRNREIFQCLWEKYHRRMPRWVARIIVSIMPLRRWRKAMRRRTGLSFQGMMRDEIHELVAGG